MAFKCISAFYVHKISECLSMWKYFIDAYKSNEMKKIQTFY